MIGVIEQCDDFAHLVRDRIWSLNVISTAVTDGTPEIELVINEMRSHTLLYNIYFPSDISLLAYPVYSSSR